MKDGRWLNEERRWIPACAGMTILRLVTFRTSSPTCDDCCVGGSHATRIPHSLPAQAGIQCLCAIGRTRVLSDFLVRFTVNFAVYVDRPSTVRRRRSILPVHHGAAGRSRYRGAAIPMLRGVRTIRHRANHHCHHRAERGDVFLHPA